MNIQVIIVTLLGAISMCLIAVLVLFIVHKEAVIAVLNPVVREVNEACVGNIRCIIDESVHRDTTSPCVLLKDEHNACEIAVVQQPDFGEESCQYVQDLGVRQVCEDAQVLAADPWRSDIEILTTQALERTLGSKWQEQCVAHTLNTQIEVDRAKLYLWIACEPDSITALQGQEQAVVVLVTEKADGWHEQSVNVVPLSGNSGPREAIPQALATKTESLQAIKVGFDVLRQWKRDGVIQIMPGTINEIICGCTAR